MASEIFAALLGLKLGIVCPRFRVIPTSSKYDTVVVDILMMTERD